MQHRGLSPSTVKKYEGAVRGAMSEWAMQNGLISGPLIAINSSIAFKQIAASIRELPIYIERNERGHNMYNAALEKFSDFLAEGHENDAEADIDEILGDCTKSVTEISSLVKARIGQGAFRQKLISHWNGCAITGFKDTCFLVASHIKPWCVCNNDERLDPFNGLLLIPNLDRAFDSGHITFSTEGDIIISPQLADPAKLGISSKMRLSLAPQHEPHLAFHRQHVFRAD